MKTLILIIIILVIPLFLISYPWPIRPFNAAHPVSATLGDGRGTVTASRFHRGIDIPADSGTNGLYLHFVGANNKWCSHHLGIPLYRGEGHEVEGCSIIQRNRRCSRACPPKL